MTESYVERWAREQREATIKSNQERTISVNSETGTPVNDKMDILSTHTEVKKNGKTQRGKRQTAEKDETNR